MRSMESIIPASGSFDRYGKNAEICYVFATFLCFSRVNARPTRLELVTCGLEDRCSIRLSYGRWETTGSSHFFRAKAKRLRARWGRRGRRGLVRASTRGSQSRDKVGRTHEIAPSLGEFILSQRSMEMRYSRAIPFHVNHRGPARPSRTKSLISSPELRMKPASTEFPVGLRAGGRPATRPFPATTIPLRLLGRRWRFVCGAFPNEPSHAA